MPTITPTYPQYTNQPLGTGLFDQLMATVKSHIQEEYDEHRIRGDNYTKLYLGSMEAVMANTTQYLISLLLIDEKRDNLVAQTEKVHAEIALVKAQTIKVETEVLYLLQKTISELANVDGTVFDAASVIGRQTSLLLGQKLGFAGDLQHKAAKLQADYDIVLQSVQEDPAQVTLQVDTLAAIGVMTTTASVIENA